MKSLLLNGRMVRMRKVSCLLIILFCMIATVFLLIYPVFTENTRAELEQAYDEIPVSGWLYNNRGYHDPIIDGDIWHRLMDTGYIGTSYAFSTTGILLHDKHLLGSKVSTASSQEELIDAFNTLSEELPKDQPEKPKQVLQALNMLQANGDLGRRSKEIYWMNGWSEDAFCSTDTPVCLIGESTGYQLGDWVPCRVKNIKSGFSVVCMQVVGVYPFDVSGINDGVLDLFVPLLSFERICQAQEQPWDFWLNGFSFLISDNRQLPQLKQLMADMELAGGATGLNIQGAIDDRILDGTVAPIKSNLAMLEGLYKFFFGVVAAIGFFLCFLLARGRRQEYAVMRLLGESAAQVTLKALLEQFLLSLLGIVLGAGILAAVGQGAPDPVTCAIILVCYTLGAAVAVVLTVRVNVMEILRDKE